MSFTKIYKRWLLDCTPQATADGRFAAHVALSKTTGSGLVAGTLTPDLAPFVEQRDAAEAAFSAARLWVDDEG